MILLLDCVWGYRSELISVRIIDFNLFADESFDEFCEFITTGDIFKLLEWVLRFFTILDISKYFFK
jgi:hypothetical protein